MSKQNLTYGIFTIALVLVLGFTMMVSAGSKDATKVGFTLGKYFALEIKTGENVDFGSVSPTESYTKKKGSTLSVDSNTNWNLSTKKKVLSSPNDADNKDVLNALTVSLETSKGKGKDNNIKVDYTLDNLEKLPSGDYVIEVTFTGAAK